MTAGFMRHNCAMSPIFSLFDERVRVGRRIAAPASKLCGRGSFFKVVGAQVGGGLRSAGTG